MHLTCHAAVLPCNSVSSMLQCKSTHLLVALFSLKKVLQLLQASEQHSAVQGEVNRHVCGCGSGVLGGCGAER